MNKNKMCLIALLLIIFNLCVPYAYASEQALSTQTSAPETPRVYTLSLSQAIDMAKRESPDLECCDVNKENIRVQRKNAKLAQKNSKNIPVNASSNFDMVFVKQGYYINMFDKQFELADYEKAKTESSIAYDVTQKYYNCKNAVAVYNSAKNALERAKENETLIKMRLSLGMCTQIDADSISLSVAQCEANLQKCLSNIEVAEDSLKIVLGIDGKCVLNLTDALTKTPFTANLTEDTQKAMNTRYDVKALRISAELADEYFKIASNLDNENTTYYSAYTNHIKSNFDYSTGVKNISLLIKNSYYTAVDSINQIKLAEDRLNLLKKEYETYKIKNELGMITNHMLNTKADELTECEIAYNNSLLAGKLAIEKYNYDITTGI